MGALYFWVFVVYAAVYAACIYSYLVRHIRYGRSLYAAFDVWLASPIPLYATAFILERRAGQVFDARSQSWAFLIGDIVVLPCMAAVLARAWQHVATGETGAWYRSLRWVIACAAAGIVAGFGFHALEAAHYVPLALQSPSKLVHDFVAYCVLTAGLLFGLVPALAANRKSRRYGVVALGCAAVWAMLVVLDNSWLMLDGRELHVMFDWEHMRPIPYA